MFGQSFQQGLSASGGRVTVSGDISHFEQHQQRQRGNRARGGNPFSTPRGQQRREQQSGQRDHPQPVVRLRLCHQKYPVGEEDNSSENRQYPACPLGDDTVQKLVTINSRRD